MADSQREATAAGWFFSQSRWVSAYSPINCSSDDSFVSLILIGKQNTACDFFFLFFHERLFSQGLLTPDPGGPRNEATSVPRAHTLTTLKFTTDSFWV